MPCQVLFGLSDHSGAVKDHEILRFGRDRITFLSVAGQIGPKVRQSFKDMKRIVAVVRMDCSENGNRFGPDGKLSESFGGLSSLIAAGQIDNTYVGKIAIN